MKHKEFKITDSTLFVYRPQRDLMNGTETTDPTTSMVTLTKTGILKERRLKK